jgi:hypothetical protein
MTMDLPRRPLPRMARVRQRLLDEAIADPRREVRERLLGFGLASRLRPGAGVAVTAGSRGYGGLVEIVAGVVDAVRAAEARPYIVPAMGSHGGATADGQIEILRRLGVTEASVGAPIRATMDTRCLGTSATGARAHLDELAAQGDAIIVLGKTQTHPENSAGIASGLLKMVTVGLGKQRGAEEAHGHGLWPSIEAVPRLTLASAKIVCGVSVVENAFRRPVLLETVPPSFEAFRDADRRLLVASRQFVAVVPFGDLDLLIVDELGKDVSGTGMALQVIGRWRLLQGPRKPDYKRIAVLSLTHGSLGNGLGIGLADVTTARFAAEYDWHATWVNLLTASEPGVRNTVEGLLPPALPSDREAVEVALWSALAGASPRVCRIRSTARLAELEISEAMLEEAEGRPELDLLSQPTPLEFDSAGHLF